jgi:membrane protease YdiL (CAAX protease family)
MTKVELHKIGKEADKTDDIPTYAGSPGNLPAFFLLTVLLSLPIFAFAVSTLHMVPEGLPINHFGFLMVFVPLTAAMILAYQENGLVGAKRLFRRAFDHRKIEKKIWYIPILLIQPLVYVSSLGLMRLAGITVPEVSISVESILILFPLFVIFVITEEGGWQGYAFDPMEQRWGTWRASVILGGVWAAWHAPLYLIQRPPGGLTWIAGQMLNIVVFRVMIVWIYKETRRSVFSSVMLHAIYNLCSMTFPNLASPLGPLVTTLVTVAVIGGAMSALGSTGWNSPGVARDQVYPRVIEFHRLE